MMIDSDNLNEIDLSTIKTRSVTGIVTLISRSFIQRIIAAVGFFLLSVFLGRPEIGLFIAVNDLVSILGYFSDIGLAASLIQKKDKLTVSDLRTTFTLQQILVVTLIGVTLLISPFLIKYYQITGGGVWLFFSLLAGFFLASLKTIPSVLLERHLRFEILASVEVAETLIFYLVAVILAWRGMGVMAYAVAVFLRGIAGTILLYKLAPWPIGIGISSTSVKTLLSFGLPYQINSLMAVVKDRFVNIALWKIIGADGVGIIGWAQNWSQLVLRFVMDNVTKVTFPAFSRMQEHPDELKSGIEKTLFFICFISFPLLGGLAIIAPSLIHLIPRYSKWEIALLPLALFCFNSAWASVSTPLTNTLNALGKVKINTYLMIMWTVLTWVITPFLALKYGFIGVAYATALIAVSSIAPILIVKHLTKFSLQKSVIKPFVATIVMMIVCWYLTKLLPNNFYYIFVNISVSGIIFLLVTLVLVGQSLIADSQKLLHAFIKKK